MDKFLEFRNTYESIVYKSYNVIYNEDSIRLEFCFEIPGLEVFNPYIEINNDIIINKDINKDLVNLIAFNIGMVELISYYKICCPKKVIIEAGYLDDYQMNWFKKLFYNGLGEFFYVNGINVSIDELFEFIIKGDSIDVGNITFNGEGNLIPIGGGKDSNVTLELLKNYDNKCFIINPKDVQLECAYAASYDKDSICIVKRILDKKMIDLNSKGYLNGHTPFSSIVSFISYLVAYLSNRRYIVLSNEGSANEPTVLDTNINHQYSKSYEYENDFKEYSFKYFKTNILYFSLLRPIKEIQIAMLFSKYYKYHNIFKSCNVGSKSIPWKWCCNCSKCLFVYIILSPFLSNEEMVNIFGMDLYENKDLLKYLLELIGVAPTKPFECVGTIDEVIYSLNKYIDNNKNSELPYLVKEYNDKYKRDVDIDLSYVSINEHNLNEEYLSILKEEIKKCIEK